MKSLILSIIWELNIKNYQKLRECGWKYRQKTLHLIPETKYLRLKHLKFEEKIERNFVN